MEFPHNIEIGEFTSIGRNVVLDPYPTKISIGKNVLIARGCYFRAGNHNFTDILTPIRFQGHSGHEIVVEDDVWIAANSTILAGSLICCGSIVAAGAVVKGTLQKNSVYGGVPAKLLFHRSSRDSPKDRVQGPQH